MVRYKGLTVNIDGTSTLGNQNDFLDLRGSTLNFESGAAVGAMVFEMKNDGPYVTSTFTFDLVSSGFETIAAGDLKSERSAAGYVWEVDMANYTGSNGTITLIDFNGEAGGTTMDAAGFQSGTLNVLNAGDYAGSTLAWDEATDSVQLNVIPEPAALGLIASTSVGLLIVRRFRM